MAWYDDTSKRTQVREYKSQNEFQNDAAKAGAYGWNVTTVTDLSQRSGCLRGCSLGLLALVFKPKSKILVTYTYTPPA